MASIFEAAKSDTSISETAPRKSMAALLPSGVTAGRLTATFCDCASRSRRVCNNSLGARFEAPKIAEINAPSCRCISTNSSRAAGSLPTSFWYWFHPGRLKPKWPSVSAANASGVGEIPIYQSAIRADERPLAFPDRARRPSLAAARATTYRRQAAARRPLGEPCTCRPPVPRSNG